MGMRAHNIAHNNLVYFTGKWFCHTLYNYTFWQLVPTFYKNTYIMVSNPRVVKSSGIDEIALNFFSHNKELLHNNSYCDLPCRSPFSVHSYVLTHTKSTTKFNLYDW